MDFVQEKAPPPEERCASLCTQNVEILKPGRLFEHFEHAIP